MDYGGIIADIEDISYYSYSPQSFNNCNNSYSRFSLKHIGSSCWLWVLFTLWVKAFFNVFLFLEVLKDICSPIVISQLKLVACYNWVLISYIFHYLINSIYKSVQPSNNVPRVMKLHSHFYFIFCLYIENGFSALFF